MALRVLCSVLSLLFCLLAVYPGFAPIGGTHHVWLQKDTCVRVRLTQSRLEMALSSVNPPSSYRLKQTGDIVEDWRSRVCWGVTIALCLGSVSQKHAHAHIPVR